MSTFPNKTKQLIFGNLYNAGLHSLDSFDIIRCDGENDCNDESDEQGCETLYWEDGNKDAYSEDIPPRPVDDDISKKLPGSHN